METVIRDVIHGDIVITDPLITRLIDTKEFQRLRNIKQLSTASITFPGAEHTRFSHSIGVYHLAKTIHMLPMWLKSMNVVTLSEALFLKEAHMKTS